MARDELVEARACKPGDAEHLPGAHDEVRIVQRATNREVLDREPRRGLPRRLTAARGAGARLDFAADHGGHDLRQRHVGDQPVDYDLPVAHDGEIIAALENLAEIMRDQDKADAPERKLPDEAQDDADLGAGQGGGRLVQDQHLRIAVDRLDDLDHLAKVVRKLLDGRLRIGGDLVAVKQRLRRLVRLSPSDDSET